MIQEQTWTPEEVASYRSYNEAVLVDAIEACVINRNKLSSSSDESHRKKIFETLELLAEIIALMAKGISHLYTLEQSL